MTPTPRPLSRGLLYRMTFMLRLWTGSLPALSINPNSARAHAVKGTFLVFTGQRSQGRQELLTALRLSPRDPFNVLMLSHIATSYYLERDYLSAFEASRRVVSRFPKYPSAYRWLAASLGQLDLYG